MSASSVYHLQDILRQHLPPLSKPQSFVLATFCLGMALAQRCKLQAVAEHLHPLGKPTTVEHRLQRFLSQGKLPLPLVQLQLTRWVVRCCGTRRAVLLVDETCLGEHLRGMVVCLAYRQRAIPLAWQCYSPEQYPQGGQVALVLALLEGIASRGWYYLVRGQSSVRLPLEDGAEVSFGEQVHRGQRWQAACRAFKKHGWLACRALGYVLMLLCGMLWEREGR